MSSISFKYKNKTISFSSIESLSDEKRNYYKKPEVKKRLKEAFEKIRLIHLNDKSYYSDQSSLPRFIEKLREDEFLDLIYAGKLRYSEFKHYEQRFLFYNDIDKELRSLLVGTTNFLIVDDWYEYETSTTINLDQEDDAREMDDFDDYF